MSVRGTRDSEESTTSTRRPPSPRRGQPQAKSEEKRRDVPQVVSDQYPGSESGQDTFCSRQSSVPETEVTSRRPWGICRGVSSVDQGNSPWRPTLFGVRETYGRGPRFPVPYLWETLGGHMEGKGAETGF